MAVVVMDRGLFKDASVWVPKLDPSVNDPMSKLFIATQMPAGGMLVHNALDKPWAGGLVSNTRPLPKYNGKPLPYSAWQFKFCFNSATYRRLARWESDRKVCIKSRPTSSVKIRNVANYSTQWNRDTGQMQIDHDPPGWVNCGFAPSSKATAPGVWHIMNYRYSFTATTFSIESIQWDDEFYAMPSQHKNIPLSNTNWTECDKHQLQNEGYDPGTVLVEYDDGLVAWSDVPITAMPSSESFDASQLSWTSAPEDEEAFDIIGHRLLNGPATDDEDEEEDDEPSNHGNFGGRDRG